MGDLTDTMQDLAWSLRSNDETDPAVLGPLLADLRGAKAAIGDAERDIEARLAEAMGEEKTLAIAGLGTLEKKHSPVKPSWDHEPLLARIAALSRDERVFKSETGEIEGEAEAALRVLATVASISYYRVGELRKRGLDAKEFRSQEGWRSTVRVIPGSKGEA